MTAGEREETAEEGSTEGRGVRRRRRSRTLPARSTSTTTRSRSRRTCLAGKARGKGLTWACARHAATRAPHHARRHPRHPGEGGYSILEAGPKELRSAPHLFVCASVGGRFNTPPRPSPQHVQQEAGIASRLRTAARTMHSTAIWRPKNIDEQSEPVRGKTEPFARRAFDPRGPGAGCVHSHITHAIGGHAEAEEWAGVRGRVGNSRPRPLCL